MLEAYEIDLNRHLAAIDREERRDRAIEDQLERLTSPGAIYNPFEYGNAQEAFDDAPMELQKLVFAEIAANPNHPMHKHIAAYWDRYARQDAEYEVDNPDEDDFDEPDRYDD